MSLKQAISQQQLPRPKSSGSFLKSSESSYNKNLMMLVDQVERLTIALEQKSEEVEQLQSKVNQSCKDPMRDDDEEIELLIKTVEDQTQQLALQASKYGELQLAYSQREQQFQMELNQLNNQCLYFQNMVQQLENQLTVQRNSQLKESNSQQFQQLAMIKQQEVNQLQLQVNTLKQELVNEKQMHRELIEAEEGRVRRQEWEKLKSFKEDIREQLLFFKSQFKLVQSQLEEKQVPNKYHDRSHSKNGTINELKMQVERAYSQINDLQRELSVITKSSPQKNDVRVDIDSTLYQIEKSLAQVDQTQFSNTFRSSNYIANKLTGRPEIYVSNYRLTQSPK